MTNLIKGRNDAPKSSLEDKLILAKFKLELMTFMVACGRDEEATRCYGQAIEILNELIEKEQDND
tara:strand:- start:205 stop:399 length:195 start_codon:yes stop_codon:yes gene_type:complete